MRPPLHYKDNNHPRFKDTINRIYAYGWFYNRPWNFTLGASPKCGTSSIKQFIWMHEQEDDFVAIQDRNVGGHVYFVARHPLDRFCSTWRSKCRDGRASHHVKIISGMSPTELMDYIDTGVKDVHWNPQVDLLNKHEAKLIPLEQLGFWWEQSGLGKLGEFNVTEGETVLGDELTGRILTHWAADAELYKRAVSEFSQDTIIR